MEREKVLRVGGKIYPLKVIVPKEEVERRIKEISKELALYLKEKLENSQKILLLINLKGAQWFGERLLRELKSYFPPEILQCDTIEVSSYDGTTQSSPQIKKLPRISWKNKHLVIVEDIVDTGNTLSFLYQLVKNPPPISLTSCVLVTKSNSLNPRPDFIGFSLSTSSWLVGCGLDLNDEGREIPEICAILEA